MKKKVIIFIAIFVIFIGSLVGYNLTKSNKDKNITREEDIDSFEVKVIDFDNLANAKVVDGKKVNTSEEVLEDHLVDYYTIDSQTGKQVKEKLLFSDVELYADEFKSYFSFKLTNDNDFDISYVSVHIAFLDDDGNYIYSSERNISNLKAHSSVDISIVDYEDYTNAATIEINAA